MADYESYFSAFEAVLYYCELFNDFKLTYSNDYQAHFLVKVENLNPLYKDYQVDGNNDDTLVNWQPYESISLDLCKQIKSRLEVFRSRLHCDFQWYYIYHDKDVSREDGHESLKKPHIHLLLLFHGDEDLYNIYYQFCEAFQRKSYHVIDKRTVRKREYNVYGESCPSVTSSSARFLGISDIYIAERIQYLVHLNNPDKFQYDTSRVVGSLDYATDSRLFESLDNRDIYDLTVDFINSHNHNTARDIALSVRKYANPFIKAEYKRKPSLYNVLAFKSR